MQSPTLVDPMRLCQIEIQVQDLARAQAFYEQAFGWPASPAELHEMVVLEVPRSCPFGISLVPRRRVDAAVSAKASNTVVLYFAVDAAEPVLARVESSGGRRRHGPLPLPGYGLVYGCEDPDGNVWGLFQDGRRVDARATLGAVPR